jgi:hypothetical protein
MADDASASIITLHQARPKKAKTAAERAKEYRARKRAQKSDALSDLKSLSDLKCLSDLKSASDPKSPQNRDLALDKSSDPELPVQAPGPVPVPAALSESNQVVPVTPAPSPALTPTFALRADTPSRPRAASILLTMAALALAIVGITMNGWFAKSLGSTDTAGWLFLAIGMAADLVALVMPSCATALWQAGHRATSLTGWAAWLMTFVFAVTAGIGFASVNIADVTTARASRVTPAVQTAQAALADAMAARDRECKGGVGRFCREREAVVNERRQAVDLAMRSVERTADPQTEAAVRVVAWATLGMLRPTGDDFAMLRLILLALLPQIGGILLMVGRAHRRQPSSD